MQPLKAITCGIAVLSMAHSWAIASPVKVSSEDFAEQRVYSPFAGGNYPDQVLFGDMHFHTEL